MKIYSALQIGAYHLSHCEDYLVTDHIGSAKLLCAGWTAVLWEPTAILRLP